MLKKNPDARCHLLGKNIKKIREKKGWTQDELSDRAGAENYGKELLLTRIPFTTIYKHSGNTEFLVLSEKYDLKMRIECKWQQVSGSVDEKLPYLYLNCIEAMPEDTVVIIIDGGGFKQGAIKWLKETAKHNKYINLLTCPF